MVRVLKIKSEDMQQRRSILVVEDDEGIRETIGEFLTSEGFEVHLAANGEEALSQALSYKDSCLVLLDLMMPVMNGWEFLRRRANIAAVAAMPVVVVSAIADAASTSRAGATRFMKKPPDLEALLKIAHQYCDCDENGMLAA